MLCERSGGQIILMMGAHVIKRGLARFVIDLMEQSIVTHLSMNKVQLFLSFRRNQNHLKLKEEWK